MDELKIASMNVRGIGNNKRRETFNWLRNKQQSMIFLQEVHCTEATIDTWRSEWGYKALFSCFSSSPAGVCILFNNNFKFDILKTFSDSSGHYIVCDIKTDEKLFTLANIYASNEDDPTFFKQFFYHLHDFPCEEIILGGDFNIVLDVKEEKKTKYFLNLEKRHYRQGTISRLKKCKNDFATTDKGILHECESFFKDLYSSKMKTDSILPETNFFSQRMTPF